MTQTCEDANSISHTGTTTDTLISQGFGLTGVTTRTLCTHLSISHTGTTTDTLISQGFGFTGVRHSVHISLFPTQATTTDTLISQGFGLTGVTTLCTLPSPPGTTQTGTPALKTIKAPLVQPS